MTASDLILRWIQSTPSDEIVSVLILPRAQQLVVLRAYRDALLADLQPRLDNWDAEKAVEKQQLAQQIDDLRSAI